MVLILLGWDQASDGILVVQDGAEQQALVVVQPDARVAPAPHASLVSADLRLLVTTGQVIRLVHTAAREVVKHRAARARNKHMKLHCHVYRITSMRRAD